MKILWSIFLFALVALQAAYLPALSLWLQWNKDYVAAELCVNRFEPELMCSGSCYVQTVTADAIGQDEGTTGQAPAPEENRTLLSPFYLLQQPAEAPVAAAARAVFQPVCHMLSPQWLGPGIFHPPRLA
ncbi:hypothetical protein [Phaeodactylibacter luteus]|uniref:Uncharacterized protein n=1 Tax=Phaeodactylibacter luteus TaxID=1564516 RepID=A0A5C6RKW6_9BACT|nr:hypothetical protein [Phaeodactylibacter luteus]TXB62594.1 hypothetical protein FRY97_13325 [Phaeodactylibacter luteus]